ncbi:phosphate/phosphite/phosphonate ABC transporter substrate-binding protein [Desulfolithobacter sp.]
MLEKTYTSLAFVFILFFFFLVTPSGAHIVERYKNEPPVRVVILPCMDPVRVYKKFHPLVHYLEKNIQRRVILMVPGDYRSFSRIIEKGGADFAYLPFRVYLDLRPHFSHEPGLSILTPDGRQQHHGLLVTRSDSGIDKVEDLRGKTLLFGAEKSTVKTLAGMLLLREHGIDVEKDLAGYAFGSSCQKNAFNVYLGTYDATFICSDSRDILEGKNPDWPIPPGSLRVVARTRPVPTWIFAALDRVPESLITEVNRVFLSLSLSSEEDRKLLDEIEAAGFVVCDEKKLRLLYKNFQL